MTSPRYVDCKCGHPRNAHPDEYEEACAVPNCVCTEYIPRTLSSIEQNPVLVASAPVANGQREAEPESPATRPRASGGVYADLLAKGKRSSSKRIANLAEKIERDLADLGDRLRADEANEAKRQRVAYLKRQLAEAEAELRGETAPAVRRTRASAPTGEYPCPEPGCEYVSTTGAGRSAHRRYQHGWSAAS